MPQEHLTFETIAKVDHGSIALAFNKLLVSAYKDLLDRPGLESSRKVVLTATLKPHKTDAGELKYIEVSLAVKGTNPEQGLMLPMRATQEGMAFQTEHNDNPDQNTLEFPEDRDEKDA